VSSQSNIIKFSFIFIISIVSIVVDIDIIL
jgi:hypothetical protein